MKRKIVAPAKKLAAKKPARRVSLKKETMRDAPAKPTLDCIETSIQRGTTMSAEAFRVLAGW